MSFVTVGMWGCVGCIFDVSKHIWINQSDLDAIDATLLSLTIFEGLSMFIVFLDINHE